MQPDETSSGNLYQGRRATLEDLTQLRPLWERQKLPVAELERRFTEFQVVLDSSGAIVGAVGLQISGVHGLIHSETYASLAEAPAMRGLLWDRIFRMAKNHGLQRLWTRPTVTFYRDRGMVDADEQALAKLPPEFGSATVDWLTLKLKEDHLPQLTVEQEFALLAQAQKRSAEATMQQAQVLRVAAYGLLLLAFGGLAVLLFILFRRQPTRRR